MFFRMILISLIVFSYLITILHAQYDEIDCSFESVYPKQYIAYKTTKDLVIDGQLNDDQWNEVAFSDTFIDISTDIKPMFDTKVKMRWDDNFLYVGAILEEHDVWANISSTCHCIDDINDQVIFHDNDFEIFIDPSGSTHYYKEFEMNAANATWILLLNQPYNDGGYENSTRVYGDQGWDMQPPLHCATYADGEINDPSSQNQYWSVEVALPLQSLIYKNDATIPPKNGDIWRINFSRVEWAIKVIEGKYQKYPSCQSCENPGSNAEDNWVWSPQGAVAMHLPERWGMLQFSDDLVNQATFKRNPEWTLRSIAMTLYYAEHSYASSNNGLFTDNLKDLYPFANPSYAINGTCSILPRINLSGDGKSFIATITASNGEMFAAIQDDRLLSVISI